MNKIEIEGRSRPTTLAAFVRWSRLKNERYSRARVALTGAVQATTLRA